MDNALFKGTPTITVLENRNSVIRSIIYHRQLDKGEMTDERITCHQFDTRGALKQSIDPRLYALQQVDKTIKPNYSYCSSLSGKVLRTDSVDAGTVIALSDIAGRPVLAVNATGVARHWQYESCSLPGRLLSITEQAKGKKTHITERFIWAGCGLAEK
jgi:insecticidal toxin complex protein TccC